MIAFKLVVIMILLATSILAFADVKEVYNPSCLTCYLSDKWFSNEQDIIAFQEDYYTKNYGKPTGTCHFTSWHIQYDQFQSNGQTLETVFNSIDPFVCDDGSIYDTLYDLTYRYFECLTGSYWNNSTHRCELGIDPDPECPVGQDNESIDENHNGVLECTFPFNVSKNLGFCFDCSIKNISTFIGNPINIGTGNKFQVEIDYQSPVRGGLSYRRYYNSFGSDTGLGIRYGAGWTADYWQRITPISPTVVEIQRPDGRHLRFRLINGSWTPDADVVLRLQELSDIQGNRTGWLLILADDTVEEYDNDNVNVGRPIAISTRDGQTTILEYNLSAAEGGDDLPNSLDRVTDVYGRALSFHYDVIGHLISVIDPAGNVIHYTRDAYGNLKSVIYPNDTPTDPNDNLARIYHYEDINFPHALTGITDENGNRFATWAYDNGGRAISSEHAGGAGRKQIVFNNDDTTTVIDASGVASTYAFVTILGVVKPAQIISDHCLDCGSVQSVAYDTNGYPTSETDFNGNITNYVYNSRGLQASRTEAVGTIEERTITTTWHTEYRVPLKITEPGKITTFTYDNKGRLLERKEEATQ